MQLLTRIERAVLEEVCSMNGYQLTHGEMTRDTALGAIRKIRASLGYGDFQTSAVFHLIEVLYSSEMNDAELRSAAGLAQRLGSRSLVVALLESGVSPEDAMEVVERVTGERI